MNVVDIPVLNNLKGISLVLPCCSRLEILLTDR